jgi:hypothetical protein
MVEKIMCWLFHKWGKWGKPELVDYVWTNKRTGLEIPYSAYIQKRACKDCGKEEINKISD